MAYTTVQDKEVPDGAHQQAFAAGVKDHAQGVEEPSGSEQDYAFRA
jgi:hypothetical protein